MYPITLYTLTRNYPLFLLIAVMLTVLEASGLGVGAGASLVVYGFIALYSHRMVLLGETHGWNTLLGSPDHAKPPIMRFMLTYVAFWCVSTVVVLIVIYTLFVGNSANFILILCVSFAVFGCLLATVGTIFPAAATGGDATVTAAIERGKQSFQTTMIRLMLGPMIAGALGILVVMGLSMALGQSIIVDFAACLVGLIPTHMTAVILSMAYNETEQGGALPG